MILPYTDSFPVSDASENNENNHWNQPGQNQQLQIMTPSRMPGQGQATSGNNSQIIQGQYQQSQMMAPNQMPGPGPATSGNNSQIIQGQYQQLQISKTSSHLILAYTAAFPVSDNLGSNHWNSSGPLQHKPVEQTQTKIPVSARMPGQGPATSGNNSQNHQGQYQQQQVNQPAQSEMMNPSRMPGQGPATSGNKSQNHQGQYQLQTVIKPDPSHMIQPCRDTFPVTDTG